MKSKKYAYLLAGALIGATVTASVPVFAGNAVQAIVASIKFNFNGVEQPLPEGYAVLSYNNRTYVPARFVADNLGSDVSWNESTNTITFTSKNQSANNNGGLFSDLNSNTSGSTNSGSTNSGNQSSPPSSGSVTKTTSPIGKYGYYGYSFSNSAVFYDYNKTFTNGSIKLTIKKIGVDPQFRASSSEYGPKYPAIILETELENTAEYEVFHSYIGYGFDIPGNQDRYLTSFSEFDKKDADYAPGEKAHGILVGDVEGDINSISSLKLLVNFVDRNENNSAGFEAEKKWIDIKFK